MKYLLPVLVVSFCSCIQDIELDIPAHEPRLAIAAIIEDSLVTVLVSSSARESNYNGLADCSIQIGAENGAPFSVPPDSLPGWYKIRKQVGPNEEVTLEVTKEGFPKATAFTATPNKITLQNGQASQDGNIDTLNGFTYITTYFVEVDYEAPTDNSYSAIVLSPSVSQVDGNGRAFTTAAADIRFSREIPFDYNALADGIIIRKKAFEKLEGTINISFKTYSSLYPKASDKVILGVSSISKSYEDFMRTGWDQQNSDVEVLFTEPVRLQSNVENGYGFFGAITSDSMHLNIR